MEILEKAKNYVADKIGDMPLPEASIMGVDMKGLGLDGISLAAKVSISNPYAVPIPIGEIPYVVKSAERVIASGSIPDPGSLKASDSTVVDVPIKVPHSILVSLIRDIAGDWDIDYLLEIGLVIDLPVIGNITIPLPDFKGEIKLPTLSDLFFGTSSEAEQTVDDTVKAT
ncbi:hypothetical protein C2S51_036633 [Perilla frutescens var. frutescens]|nr:hypothetical protein C2S51_036633 [Perilla frutescens var. frutescens]